MFQNLKFSHLLCLIILSASAMPLQAQQLMHPQQDDLFRGITLYENGQYFHAIEAFNQFIELSLNDVQKKNAAYFLSLSKAAYQPERSDIFFDQFIAQYPETELAGLLFIDLAHRASAEGNLNEAAQYYDRALELNLNEFERAQVLYWNAETHVSKGDYDRAHYYYNTLSSKHPRSEWVPKAMFNQGRLYLTQKRFDAASRTFEELRKRYPADRVVRRIGTALGQAYYQQERYNEAIESLRQVLANLDKEQETKAVLLIAESYNYLDELNDAATWYRRYIALTEGTSEERFAHYGLGWVFHKQGVYHWAAESFSKVTGSDELARKALYYEAVNHKLSGRYELALESFKKFGDAYTSGTWVERAYYEWAITAFEIGDYVTAIEKNLFLIRSDIELETPGEIYSLLGEAYFANGEYGRAIESFERAESFGEKDDELQLQARFQRAWVLYSNQAYEEAQAIFEHVYQTDPQGKLAGEALFWSADSYFNMEEYGPASARFQRFMAEFRDHEFIGAAQYSLGWCYFKLGQYEQAITPFRQFLNDYKAPPIALFPYDVDTRLRLGDAHFALGRYDDAIDYYNNALVSEKGADYAKFQIANSYYRSEQTFESVRSFRQLIVQYPSSSLREQAQYNIGYIFLLAGNYTQSIREFELLLELSPNSRWAPRAQFNIGNAYYNAGDNSNAIAAYKKVLERYPRSDLIIEAVNGIQFAQEAEGMPDNSNEILEDFLAENPQAGTADKLRFRQAERMLQTGDLDGAIEAFRQYIRISSNQSMIAQAWFNLGDAYERKGNRNEAKEAYRTIITDFGTSDRHSPALSRLGRLLLDEGDYNQALNMYDELSKRGGAYRFEANIGLGNASLGLNRFEQAGNYFEKAKSLNGDENLADLGLGKVAQATNRQADALNLFNKVAESSNAEAGAEAQYLAGILYQQQRNHEQAIRAFSNVRLFFGGYTDWVLKSMLGSVKSNISVGNQAEADRIIDLILKDYPGTDEAREAQNLRTN